MSEETYPEIRTGTADAVLAGIWRNILRDLAINPARLSDLIQQYSKRMTHLTPARQTQFYGNVMSDLREDHMTWKTFRRGPMVLGACKMEIKLTLQHLNCRTEHKYIIEYNDPSVPVESDTEEPTDLSAFFTRIMMDLGVGPAEFNRLLTVYMKHAHVRITPANATFLRGKLNKDFTGKRLSWAGFIKGLSFLTVPRFEATITLTFPGKRIRKTVHHRNVVLDTIEDMKQTMEDSDFLDPQALAEQRKPKK